MNLKRYRLANLTHTVPMPDRGGRLFEQTEEGMTIDVENAFYATMIKDRDLVPAEEPAAPPVVAPSPTPEKPKLQRKKP